MGRKESSTTDRISLDIGTHAEKEARSFLERAHHSPHVGLASTPGSYLSGMISNAANTFLWYFGLKLLSEAMISV